MKTIIFNASPRKNGNTSSVTSMFQSILSMENEAEVFYVKNLNIKQCIACDSCKENGGNCVFNDDSNMVLNKINEADAIIFVTPVYWWGMTAQLKLLVDKFYARTKDFQKMNKKVGVVAIGASDVENPQYRLIREQFECISEYLNWDMKFSLSFSASEPGDILNINNLNEQIDNACKKLFK